MIYIVSGLPRSGTSLAMQMLAAGGLPVLTDGLRQPDANNLRGYYEWERIKQLAQDPACMAEAEGKAVKVISSLLLALPPGHDYRVLFMMRPLEEVVASQAAMIAKLGAQGANLPPAAMIAALRSHRNQVIAWLESRRLPVIALDYHALMADPAGSAARVAGFFELPLDVEAMSSQVDPALHRQRAQPAP
ncbi:MAG TPA: sulfotransferase family protein [Terriglobia bacterium]|jgi:LPS sulfotransferase NodH|nr:sulfotransferase family protein [Terriglobia bacterium]